MRDGRTAAHKLRVVTRIRQRRAAGLICLKRYAPGSLLRPAYFIAALALTGCAPHPGYISTPCLSKAQYEQLKKSQPPKIKSQLTGDASKDVGILAGSAIRLRAHDDGLLTVLGGCVDPKTN
jgi:hypothetical protein